MRLNLIYHFQASQNQDTDFRPASYGVVYFFSEDGFLETDFLKEMSKSIPAADHVNLTFPSLDDLKDFALRVSQEFHSTEVRVISVHDFNIGLDGARDITGLKDVFHRYGEVILSEESSKKKGFLKKFFS